jgi:hypothetical protein
VIVCFPGDDQLLLILFTLLLTPLPCASFSLVFSILTVFFILMVERTWCCIGSLSKEAVAAASPFFSFSLVSAGGEALFWPTKHLSSSLSSSYHSVLEAPRYVFSDSWRCSFLI